jgi:membrane-bound ClpP family serine protease
MFFARKFYIWMMGICLGLFLSFNIAYAESVSSVTTRVNTAYAAGQIDAQTYSDLKGALSSASNAANAQDYASATEAYNLLAPGDLSASFDSYGR